jgi:hypothetical protein
MKKKLLIAFGTLILGVVTLGLSLPTIVHRLGLHPTYEGATYDLAGKRALVISTSHGVLNAPGEVDGPPTGVMASELTHPYYGFLDADMHVDVASIKGGPIPIDPQTLNFVVRTPEDERYLEDPALEFAADRRRRLHPVRRHLHRGWLGCRLRPRLLRCPRQEGE